MCLKLWERSRRAAWPVCRPCGCRPVAAHLVTALLASRAAAGLSAGGCGDAAGGLLQGRRLFGLAGAHTAKSLHWAWQSRAVRGRRVNRQANAGMGCPGCCRAAGLACGQLGPTVGQPGTCSAAAPCTAQPQHMISHQNKVCSPGWSAARAPCSPCSSAAASPGACREEGKRRTGHRGA